MFGKDRRGALSAPRCKKAAAAAVLLAGCAMAFALAFGNAPAGSGEDPSAQAWAAENKDDGALATAGKSVAECIDLAQIPSYTGSPYIELNGNEPFFDPADYPYEYFESYAPLDRLGRCGECVSLVGRETMPTEERGPIGAVEPTGWREEQYDWVDGGYVYNRCHMLGYQLTAENANPRNLITGTRCMNVQGMEPFENQVADYVKETGNHVLYRVTPLFAGDELVSRGVVMEARSLEDNGEGLSFCVFCYNVEPGVAIDYATGENWADGFVVPGCGPHDCPAVPLRHHGAAGECYAGEAQGGSETEAEYVLNTRSRKFHTPDCPSVDRMSETNKGYFQGTREEAIAHGFDPCKSCNP